VARVPGKRTGSRCLGYYSQPESGGSATQRERSRPARALASTPADYEWLAIASPINECCVHDNRYCAGTGACSPLVKSSRSGTIAGKVIAHLAAGVPAGRPLR